MFGQGTQHCKTACNSEFTDFLPLDREQPKTVRGFCSFFFLLDRVWTNSNFFCHYLFDQHMRIFPPADTHTHTRTHGWTACTTLYYICVCQPATEYNKQINNYNTNMSGWKRQCGCVAGINGYQSQLFEDWDVGHRLQTIGRPPRRHAAVTNEVA